MIRNDIELAKSLYHLAMKEEELQAVSTNLSITTFRYTPKDLTEESMVKEAYLNLLNEQLLNRLQLGGKVFLSNAVVGHKYCLRACIVNFRTGYGNLKELIETVLEVGKEVDMELRSRVREN